MESENVKCNLCEEGEMQHAQQGETHIWVCDSCPAVMFEYENNKNVHELTEYLNRDRKNKCFECGIEPTEDNELIHFSTGPLGYTYTCKSCLKKMLPEDKKWML